MVKRKTIDKIDENNLPKVQKSITTFFIRKNESAKKIDSNSPLFSLLQDVGWRKELAGEFSKSYFKSIEKTLNSDKSKGIIIFPPRDQVFAAFNLAPLIKLRVVIIGQDPYHGDRQAHGLSFSVPRGVCPPPSLGNVYKELTDDVNGFKIPDHGCLVPWARQGVLLLNSTLTVQAHRPNSHSQIGWQTFTDAVIRLISYKCDGVVFLLWGAFAHKKEGLVDISRHAVIKTAHPSPLSASKFFGSRCFSRTNKALIKFNKEPIDWSL